MNRRDALFAAAAAMAAPLARAHHGWSSFDQNRPIYLEGKATKVAWRNPHAEFVLEVAPELTLPADLRTRVLPAQTAPVDTARLLQTARLPDRRDRHWTIELAPISRMQAWQVTPLKDGDRVALVGYTFADEKGDPVVRVEYLFAGGKAYGLRSSPA